MGMIHASKALGAKGLAKYHSLDFANDASRYYSKGVDLGIGSAWQGKGAEALGISGPVDGEMFKRLANGQHPETGEQIIKHRVITSEKSGKILSHRAGWDFTYNADKSVSLTALHDPRIYYAHRQAVNESLKALEEYAQSRSAANINLTSGNLVIAKFEHNSARPVDGYAAPHLHTHAVVFNLTHDGDKYRALQERELFASQKYASAVYQSELALRLRNLGYDVRQGKNHAPTIHGYSQEYLDVESARSREINKKVAELGYSGRKAQEMVAHQYRDGKQNLDPEEQRRLHMEKAALYGNQGKHLVEEAKERAKTLDRGAGMSAADAVTFARNKVSERLAVFDERDIIKEALWASQNYVRVDEIRANLKSRTQTEAMREQGKLGDFVPVHHDTEDPNKPGRRYTTMAGIESERAVLEFARQSRETVKPIAKGWTIERVEERFAKLTPNSEQVRTIAERLASRDRVNVIEGFSGVGKTSRALTPLQEIAKENGFEVIGMAPTTKARKILEEDGIKQTMTLQRFLIRDDKWLQEKKGIDPSKPRLYIVDESSLVSTNQVRTLLTQMMDGPRKNSGDRVIFVGDRKQHESVQAARIFEELVQGGASTSSIEKLVRPRNEQLRKIGEMLQFDKTTYALNYLHDGSKWDDGKSRVMQSLKRDERLASMADRFVLAPKETLMVAPDNATRRELNGLVRDRLREAGTLGRDALNLKVYSTRNELTAEDNKLALSYRVGDVVQYANSSRVHNWKYGEYATVIGRDTDKNTVTVQFHRPLPPGQPAHANIVTYTPSRNSKVQVYEPQMRQIAVGDKLVIKAPWDKKGLVNGDVLEITGIDKGILSGKTDKGRTIKWNAAEMPHLDYAYASTSYMSQGSTVKNVLIHMDTSDKYAIQGLTKQMAYVAISRGTHDVRIYTDDLPRLQNVLNKTVEKTKALAPDEIAEYAVREAPKPSRSPSLPSRTMPVPQVDRSRGQQQGGYGM